VVGHTIPRSIRPDLIYAVDNTRVAHRACSDASATSVVIAKAKHDVLVERGMRVQLSALVPASWYPLRPPVPSPNPRPR
jgi:hypothetical protein